MSKRVKRERMKLQKKKIDSLHPILLAEDNPDDVVITKKASDFECDGLELTCWGEPAHHSKQVLNHKNKSGYFVEQHPLL